ATRAPALAGAARSDDRSYARAPDRSAGQRLVAISSAGRAHVRAQRLLSIGRRVGFPRPVAGLPVAVAHAARPRARTTAALRRTAVPRRRRAALVAPALRQGRAHAHQRRL